MNIIYAYSLTIAPMKRSMAHKNDITLIDVPYWWDGTPEKYRKLVF